MFQHEFEHPGPRGSAINHHTKEVQPPLPKLVETWWTSVDSRWQFIQDSTSRLVHAFAATAPAATCPCLLKESGQTSKASRNHFCARLQAPGLAEP